MVEFLEKKITFSAFREMDFPETDHFIYELINGNIVKRTAPSLPHQRVSRRLTYFLEKFLMENPVGEFFCAPTDVSFDETVGVVPDLSYISNDRDFILFNDDYVRGTPDIIFEIISPGTGRRDRTEKKVLYESYAVGEYWLVDPANRTVEIFIFKENIYFLDQFLEIEDTAISKKMPGFVVDLKALFG